MKTVVLPALVILMVGTIIGLGVNRVRTDIRIKVTHNYFKRSPADVRQSDGGSVSGLNHSFKVVSIDEMIDMANSEEAYRGDILIIDARDDDHYEEGHLPGALQIYNYNVDKYYDQARPYLEAAEIVVIYCGGGDCEDSIFLATELQVRGLGPEQLRIFEGGIAQWRQEGMPVDEGRPEGGFSEWSQADWDDTPEGGTP